MKRTITLFGLIVLVFSCKSKEEQSITIGPEDFHGSVDKVTEIMIHDIFSPPVASRIFAYPNIAAYEIIAQADEEYVSLAGQVHGLKPIPELDSAKNVNAELAALIAHIDVSKELIFSEDRMIELRDSLYTVWKNTNERQFEDSKAYGLEVAQHIKTWLSKDNYSQTRTMPKFTVMTEDESRWQPTPPSYMDGIEPHWNKIRSFTLDSAEQFKPLP
ncbi:MAG: phosphatidic acid phosphatase, partial [Saonia sp.]